MGAGHATDTVVAQTPVRLHECRLKGLFGLFDHKIALNTEHGVTIIHGANGVGKTRILQMLAALPTMKLNVLRRTPFERFDLHFSDGTDLTISRADLTPTLPLGEMEQEVARPREPGLVISLASGGAVHEAVYPARVSQGETTRDINRYIDMELGFVDRMSPDTWFDSTTGDELSLIEVVERYSSHLPPGLRDVEPHLPPFIAQFLRGVQIHFIETQRLQTHVPDREARYRGRPRPALGFQPTVEYYARDLGRELERHLADYAGMSATLDRTFPQRALTSLEEDRTGATVSESYEELTALRNRLTKAGLLEKSYELPWPARELNDTETQFLALYFDDTRRKLSVFETLLQKLELLSEMLDQRFLYKHLEIDRRRGFYFASPSGETIPPSELSSGEQHELVFAYRLLFKVASGSLVLIDEPEISLNVAWQQRFIPDLERIREITNLDFLIATHSPQIIHDRWELAQRLGGSSE